MGILGTLLVLIGLHALYVAAEFAFVRTAFLDEQPDSTPRRSILSANIGRQLEDYLTVCALAKTMILLSVGVLLGIILSDLMQGDPGDLNPVSWNQWAQFGSGFLCVVLVQLVVGFELPKMLATCWSGTFTEVLGWLLVISRMLVCPLLWLVNQLKRSAYHFV